MHLIIDLGNSKIKFFVFQENRILYRSFNPILEWENTLKQIQKKYSTISNCKLFAPMNFSTTMLGYIPTHLF